MECKNNEHGYYCAIPGHRLHIADCRPFLCHCLPISKFSIYPCRVMLLKIWNTKQQGICHPTFIEKCVYINMAGFVCDVK